MSMLFALVFEDAYRADEARAALHRMNDDVLPAFSELTLLARRSDGTLRLSQDVIGATRRNDARGHVAGLVAAAAASIQPMALPAMVADDMLAMLLRDAGTRAFITELGAELRPGRSVLVLLADPDASRAGAVVARLRGWDPRVLQTDVPATLLQALDARLAGAPAETDPAATS